MATVTKLRSLLSRVLFFILAFNSAAHSLARPGLLLQLDKSSSKNLSPRCLKISTVFPYIRMGRIPTRAVVPVVEIATLTTTVNASTPTGLTTHSLPTGSYGGPATLSRSPNQPAVEWSVQNCEGCVNSCISCGFCGFCVGCFNCNDCGGCGSCGSCAC